MTDEFMLEYGRHEREAAARVQARQMCFPGAPAATDATMAQRRANAPLRARVNQRACDHGLFSDERDQSDLVQQLRR